MEILHLQHFDDLDLDLNATLLGKLQGIRLKTQQHLHDPLLVAVDHRAVNWLVALRHLFHLNDRAFGLSFSKLLRGWPRHGLVLMDVLGGQEEVDALLFGLVGLQGHHTFNCCNDVEWLNVDAELPRLDLCVVEQVLDDEAHQARRRFLYSYTLF